MVKALLVCVWLLAAPGLPGRSPALFSGCIVYEHEYQTIDGEPLYFAVKPKSWFYVQGNNLKRYDRNKKLQELYLGATNDYYRFDQGQARPKIAATQPTAAATRRCLSTTAIILGHACQVLQLVRDGVSTLVYYSPELRISAADFSRCPSPGFYALLQATDGALPLRTISIDTEHDVVARTEVIEVQARPLAADEFTPTALAR